MEIKLHYCTLCYLMLFLAGDNYNLCQGRLFGRYVACIDPNNAILHPDKDSTEDEEISLCAPGASGFDSSRISNILSGKSNLRLKYDPEKYINKVYSSADCFRKIVAKCFTSDSKCLLIQIMIDLIQKDEYAEVDGLFEKTFGMQRAEYIKNNSFEFSELMIRIFLFTALKTCYDKDYQKYSQEIRKDINKKGRKRYSLSEENCVTAYIKEVKASICRDDYLWNEEIQTLSFVERINSRISFALPVVRRKTSSDVESAAFSLKLGQSDVPGDKMRHISTVSEQTNEKDNAYSLQFNTSNLHQSELTIDPVYKTCQFCLSFIKNQARGSHQGKCGLHCKPVYFDNSCEYYEAKYSAITLAMLKKN